VVAVAVVPVPAARVSLLFDIYQMLDRALQYQFHTL
jgi:hypothetical protein